jgi:hypothetical protein
LKFPAWTSASTEYASCSTCSTGIVVRRIIWNAVVESFPPPVITIDATVKSFRPIRYIADSDETRTSSRSIGQIRVTWPVSFSIADDALIAPSTTVPSGLPIEDSPLSTWPWNRSNRLSIVPRARSSS